MAVELHFGVPRGKVGRRWSRPPEILGEDLVAAVSAYARRMSPVDYSNQNSDLTLDITSEIRGSGTAPEERGSEQQYCVFRAGRERFCLSVLEVEEVVDWPPITPIPLAPAFLMGIFNLRGTIVPLVDIAFTEGRRGGLMPKQVVVAVLKDVAQGEDMHVGIAADEVIGTYSARDESFVDQSPNDVPHCRGMLRHDERLALILDLPRLAEIFQIPVM